MAELPSIQALRAQLPRMATRRGPDEEVDRQRLSLTGPASPLGRLSAEVRCLAPATAPRPVQGTVDLEETFRHYCMGDKAAATHALRSATGLVHGMPNLDPQEGFLLDQLETAISHGGPVIAYLDWLGYSVAQGHTGANMSEAHSTALIFTRSTDGPWRAFHCNPHGSFTEDDHVYEQYRTRTRTRPVQLPQVLDVWLVGQLVDCLNEQIEEHVVYHGTGAYNYFGPNLQTGDRAGVCYVFPFLLHYIMACDPSRMVLRAIAQGKGTAGVARAGCALLGVACPRRLTNKAQAATERAIRDKAAANARELPLLLLRAVSHVRLAVRRG